jgi:hypothetical protein
MNANICRLSRHWEEQAMYYHKADQATSLMNQVIAHANSSNHNYNDFFSTQVTGSYMDLLQGPFPLEVFT